MKIPNPKSQTPDRSRRPWRGPAITWPLIVLGVLSLTIPAQAAAEPLQSPRLERAKDLIAEEQWERAIE